MGYRTIATVWDGSGTGQRRAEAALGLARRFDAHLSFRCYGLQPAFVGFGQADFAGAVIAELAEAARREAAERRAAADAFLARAGHPGEAEADIAMIEGLAATFGASIRFAELVVLGRPYGPDAAGDASALLDGALYDADLPALVLPDGTAEVAGRNVVIAWNGTREALRAVRGAMPFLREAEAVEIAAIDPEAGDPAEGPEPGARLALMLARHGIRAEVVRVPGLGRPVHESLRERIRDRGADLLVMGAWGHSRLREWVLGGATRDILADPPVPVLTEH